MAPVEASHHVGHHIERLEEIDSHRRLDAPEAHNRGINARSDLIEHLFLCFHYPTHTDRLIFAGHCSSLRWASSPILTRAIIIGFGVVRTRAPSQKWLLSCACHAVLQYSSYILVLCQPATRITAILLALV